MCFSQTGATASTFLPHILNEMTLSRDSPTALARLSPDPSWCFGALSINLLASWTAPLPASLALYWKYRWLAEMTWLCLLSPSMGQGSMLSQTGCVLLMHFWLSTSQVCIWCVCQMSRSRVSCNVSIWRKKREEEVDNGNARKSNNALPRMIILNTEEFWFSVCQCYCTDNRGWQACPWHQRGGTVWVRP